jgi:hypothetical protein
VVTPFSESRESKRWSVSPNFSTSSKLRLNRTPRSSLNGKPSTAQVTSVLDKFSNVATRSDILMPLGWTEAKDQDSDRLQAWKRPGGTDPISAKVPKVAPGTIVVWSTDAGVPCGPD